jgi:hypothetical protein
MTRNRTIGAPYQNDLKTATFTTSLGVDRYLVQTPSGGPAVVVTLDPNAVGGDQVVISDVGGNAATYPIVVNASSGQTIIGHGTTTSIADDDASIQFTYSHALDGWVADFWAGSEAAASGGILDFAMFYSNVSTGSCAPGTAFGFPSAGPAKAGTGITASTSGSAPNQATTFTLAAVGFYEVTFQAPDVTGADQLQLRVGGAVQNNGVSDHHVGQTQLVGNVIIQTTLANTTLQVWNPAGNSNNVVIPATNGSNTVQPTATITIKQIG